MQHRRTRIGTIRAAVAAGLASALATSGLVVVATVAHAATTPPWEPDPHAVAPYGSVSFYDASGTLLTGGNDLTHLADFAAASTDGGPTDLGGVKATLQFANPTPSTDPGNWPVGIASKSTAYPNPSAPAPITGPGFTHPLVTIDASSANLSTFISGHTANTASGYQNVYQVRVVDSGPNGGSGASYWETDITVDPAAGTWNVLYPAPPATSVPGAPILNTATAGNTSVGLSWTVGAGSGIDDYRVSTDVTGNSSPTVTDLASIGTATTVTGLTNGTSYTLAVAAHNASGWGPYSNTLAATPKAAAIPHFVQVAPSRILDTRLGTGAPKAPVSGQATLGLTVSNRGGVPASGVSAVVLNVTVVSPTAAGFVTAYPSGTSRPTASNLNFSKGQVIANLVVVPIGGDGKVDLFNGSGSTTQLIADVAGYYTSGTPSQPGSFGSLAPARILDTRNGTGVAAGVVSSRSSIDLQVTGAGRIPASGVGAVILNVTVTSPTAGGYITVYPKGAAKPTVSNLNFVKGQTVPNLVVVPVGTGGKVTFYNGSGGTVNLIADVAGYFVSGTAASIGAFTPVTPTRVLDTRTGTGAPVGAVSAQGVVNLQVTGDGVVPTSGVSAVVLNVTATGPTSSGYLTVYPAGISRPTASNLNFLAGGTVPNLVMVAVGAGGKVSFFNGSGGKTNVIADLAGYYRS